MIAVQVRPSCLRHPDRGVFEEVDQVPDDRWARNEIGIKYQQEIALCACHARFQRSGLIAGAVVSMEIDDIESLVA